LLAPPSISVAPNYNRTRGVTGYTCTIRACRKLTLTIDEEVYEALYRRVGHAASAASLRTRPTARHERDEGSLAAAYAEWAEDEEAVREAIEWSNGLIGNVANEAW
jgi:hypothetical protein